jgi:hypothetical protein
MPKMTRSEIMSKAGKASGTARRKRNPKQVRPDDSAVANKKRPKASVIWRGKNLRTVERAIKDLEAYVKNEAEGEMQARVANCMILALNWASKTTVEHYKPIDILTYVPPDSGCPLCESAVDIRTRFCTNPDCKHGPVDLNI